MMWHFFNWSIIFYLHVSIWPIRLPITLLPLQSVYPPEIHNPTLSHSSNPDPGLLIKYLHQMFNNLRSSEWSSFQMQYTKVSLKASWRVWSHLFPTRINISIHSPLVHKDTKGSETNPRLNKNITIKSIKGILRSIKISITPKSISNESKLPNHTKIMNEITSNIITKRNHF